MKKLTYTVFVAFWSCVGTIALLNTLAADAEVGDSGSSPTGHTLAEVAEHDQIDDCWMVVEGRVYDFTDYIEQHPTPPSVLAPWCGRDATEGMRTKGYGREHSERAWQMAESYRIGELQDP